MKKRTLSVMSVFVPALLLLSGAHAKEWKLPKKVYEEKVYASWLGQCVGNIYGLPHENRYVDEPGPETFPYGYGEYTKYLRESGGAFSDDDTDLEYMDLLAMEQFGPEPSYEQLAGRWMHHIKNKIWIANRAALAAMRFGYTPPVTGLETINPHWFQIDPQLINEIWGVTAPGMVQYAAAKSAWGARITNDSWGIEPTVHYGAMYAAAFFESDVRKLIDIGTAALPEGSRFAQTVEDMKRLYAKHPGDWKKARAEMAQKYYIEEPPATKTIWNANLNGACGILALLYGGGDFQKTLDMACAMGFDADNQAATMCGLLATAKELDAIPKELLFPFPDLNWKEPFNDFYKNLSREDMPDASLKDIARRMAAQGERIILSHGGKLTTENGIEMFTINPAAVFTPPLEIPKQPMPSVEAGKALNFAFLVVGAAPPNLKWEMSGGSLPKGITFTDGILAGAAKETGSFDLTVRVSDGKRSAERGFTLVSRSKNLAPSARTVLARLKTSDPTVFRAFHAVAPEVLYASSVEVIRDGKSTGPGSVFNSLVPGPMDEQDYYGYEWETQQRIGLASFTTGTMEGAGWFVNLRVEYRAADGSWKSAENLRINPALREGYNTEDKPHYAEYLLAFDAVETTAMRIIGDPKDKGNKPTTRAWTSITELMVHGPLGEGGK